VCRPPTTISATRLRTVNETFAKVLEKDRDLLVAVKKRAWLAQTRGVLP
jgi:hypothetical protein